MIRLYQFQPSGNCYKVRLLLNQLGIPFEKIEIDLTGDTAKLASLPFRRVPAVELESGEMMGESNAILIHFAEGSKFYPSDKRVRAQILQWLFWEQYDHEPYIAVVRAWKKFFGVPAGRESEVAMRFAKGQQALARLEEALRVGPFLAGKDYTVADIALYAYTHVAADGGFDLAAFPAVSQWMKRVAAEPRHLTLES